MGFLSSAGGLVGGGLGAMFGGPAGAAAGFSMGSAAGNMLGGTQSPAPISAASPTDGIQSSLQGSNVPPPDSGEQPSESTGSQAMALVQDTAKNIIQGVASQAQTSATNAIVNQVFGNPALAQAKQQGQNARAFMDAAYPEANPWDLLGAGGGTDFASAQNASENATQMQDKQFDQQKQLQQMQLNTQLQIAGIQAATSRANTQDQVYSQNAQLTDRIQNIRADTANKQAQMNEIASRVDLNRQQKINLMSSKGLIDSQTQGQLETNQNIPLSGQLIQAQTGRTKYGQGTISSDSYSIFNQAHDGYNSDNGHALVSGFDSTLQRLHDHFQHQADIHKNSGGLNGAISGKPKDKPSYQPGNYY